MEGAVSRRALVRGAIVWGGVAFVGGAGRLVEELCAQASCDGAPLGELLGHVPLHGHLARATPFGEMLGGPGLDARLFTDLSRLEPARMRTPGAEMFVRTAAPAALPAPAAWRIAIPGGNSLSIESLRRDAKPMGAHLIECSGNADPDNFGLMSVVDWTGVPLADVIARLDKPRDATGVLVNGFDDTATPTRSSSPGASWVFRFADLTKTGAFLAVGMNDEPLTRDHGAPVRLVVPGWYGCCWIKWVDALRFVGNDEPSTSQMIEFSMRTHQPVPSALARDYEPPVIDLAATPIRIEKRRVEGRLEYRVIGIVWGGDRVVEQLMIRFNAGEQPQPFTICPRPATHRTWSLWEYRWRPRSPGLYSIGLQAADRSIRTRRLDVSYYVRRAVIDEI